MRKAIALYGRDCSVQRRHQKIIEAILTSPPCFLSAFFFLPWEIRLSQEGPVYAAPAYMRERMEKAACALTKSVGYEGVGTVES